MPSLDDPDPFCSQGFGWTVKALLDGGSVALTDPAFALEGRRRRVAAAFRRTFPGLRVEEILMGDGTEDAAAELVGIAFEEEAFSSSILHSNEAIAVACDAPPHLLSAALRMPPSA